MHLLGTDKDGVRVTVIAASRAQSDLRERRVSLTGQDDAVRTGFIDHLGIGVPDLEAAKRYYDELMPILGLRPWFPTPIPASSTSAPMVQRFSDLLLSST